MAPKLCSGLRVLLAARMWVVKYSGLGVRVEAQAEDLVWGFQARNVYQFAVAQTGWFTETFVVSGF